jgi:hypothetical protein
MKYIVSLLVMTFSAASLFAATDPSADLQRDLQRLQEQTFVLQQQLDRLQKQLVQQRTPQPKEKPSPKVSAPVDHKSVKTPTRAYHDSPITVHLPNDDPEGLAFYPTALVADHQVVTYIAGTPVVSSPYLGSRPAFDGSDYIVNISSINRDIRLMQQRQKLYKEFNVIGYAAPNMPILALSGKVVPVAVIGDPFLHASTDVTLGSGELDLAAILNRNVEGYLGLAYDASPPDVGGQRLSNSSVDLNMGFVNIGNLDKTPFYLTAGQLFVPFGRFSSSMVSAPLTTVLARTKARPFILGYQSQRDRGLFAAFYGFRSDTTIGSAGVGGLNLGYIFKTARTSTEIGASYLQSLNDAGGMQFTGSPSGTTFGGFSSITNGNEAVRKTPGAGIHANVNVDRFTLTAEWVGSTERFRTQDLSYHGVGAQPQAGQLEAGVTFKTFDKPASFSLGYQWSKEALALNLPAQRIAGVFNISLWKDTVESLEYRHDMSYPKNQYANGAFAPGFTNANTISTGEASDTLLAQIGVYF